MAIGLNFVKTSEFGLGCGLINISHPRDSIVIVYIIPKFAHNKVYRVNNFTLRNSAFENKPVGPWHKTVCTYPPIHRAAVRTQSLAIRLPPHHKNPPFTMPAWCGNCPTVASWPPTIFGAIGAGAPSEIKVNPLVNFYTSSKFTYIPTHRILHN
jgi:hypothetical protein